MHIWSHLCLQKRAVQQVVLPIAKHAYLMWTPVQLWLCMVHLQNNHRQVKNFCSALIANTSGGLVKKNWQTQLCSTLLRVRR